MLSVAVQKDINSYKPKIVAGLTARSLACSAIAVGVAILVGCYCWFVLGLPYDVTTYVIIFFSMPFWAAGFVHPHNLDLEKFIPLWIRHNFGNNKLVYKSSFYIRGNVPRSNALANADKYKEINGMRTTKTYQMMCKRPDFEAYRPSEGGVSK